MRLPIRLGYASYQGVKEITGVEVAFGQRIKFDVIECQGDERVQPDLLGDEQPQALDVQRADRLLVQCVRGADQLGRVGRRVAPTIVLDLLDRPVRTGVIASSEAACCISSPLAVAVIPAPTVMPAAETMSTARLRSRRPRSRRVQRRCLRPKC